MSKRVGLYLRVSTGDQSVDNQRQALRAAAEYRGWTVIEEFVDGGISGAKGRDRRPIAVKVSAVSDPCPSPSRSA